MSISAINDAVGRFRTEWADRFVDTVTISRIAARGVFNDATLKYDGGTSSTVYSGGALIRPGSGGAATDEFGEELVTGQMFDVYVPQPSDVQAEPEDVVLVTAVNTDLANTSLVGKQFVVVAMEDDSYETRTKLVCRLELGAGHVD